LSNNRSFCGAGDARHSADEFNALIQMFPALAPPFWAVMIILNITIRPALPASVGNPAVVYTAAIEENAAPG